MIYRRKITDASNGEDTAGVKVTIDNGVTVVRYRRRERYIAALLLGITVRRILSSLPWMRLHISQGHSHLRSHKTKTLSIPLTPFGIGDFII